MIEDMYGFLLNMWIMGKVDESYLERMVVVKKYIDENEKDMIVATPQLPKTEK